MARLQRKGFSSPSYLAPCTTNMTGVLIFDESWKPHMLLKTDEKIEKYEISQHQALNCLKAETNAMRSASCLDGSNNPSEISNLKDGNLNTEICNRRLTITGNVGYVFSHECLGIDNKNHDHLEEILNSSISEKNCVFQEKTSYAHGLEDHCSTFSRGNDEMGNCERFYDIQSIPKLQVEVTHNVKRKQDFFLVNYMTVPLGQMNHRERECKIQMLDKCILESVGNCKNHQDYHKIASQFGTSEKAVTSSNLVIAGTKDEDNVLFTRNPVNTRRLSNRGQEARNSSTCTSKTYEDTHTHDNFAETFDQVVTHKENLFVRKDSCVGENSLLFDHFKGLPPDMTREQMIVINKRLVSPEKPFIRREKKLLVLDLNGLLADVLCVSHCSDKVYKRVKGKSVFKRPFCDEFLNFCFEAFHVGLWSSRQKKNIDPMVDYLLGKRKHELLFCWDLSKCTNTGFRTLENFHKPLVLKDLKKLWNKEEMDLPWDKGTYLPWNTLLLDDSPYKALCNPPYTAVFPPPYSYLDENDNSLGPGGDIRVYLEGLVMANDVQYYVQQNAFGQNPITEMHSSWLFYQHVIETVNDSLHPSFSRW